MILDIDSRVSLPGRFVDAVATALLSSLTKVKIAHFTQVSKANSLWISPHFSNGVLNPDHTDIVPLLALSRCVRLLGGLLTSATTIGAKAMTVPHSDLRCYHTTD